MSLIISTNSLIIREVLNENELNYNVLKSSQGKLQENVMKNGEFHLKN